MSVLAALGEDVHQLWGLVPAFSHLLIEFLNGFVSGRSIISRIMGVVLFWCIMKIGEKKWYFTCFRNIRRKRHLGHVTLYRRCPRVSHSNAHFIEQSRSFHLNRKFIWQIQVVLYLHGENCAKVPASLYPAQPDSAWEEENLLTFYKFTPY